VVEPGRAASTPARGAGPFALRADVLEVRPGPVSWSIEIRRGDWCRVEAGAVAPPDAAISLGAADGLTWNGPPAAIVQAVVATLDDPGWFEVGMPIATPSIVLDGLGPWRLPDPGD
jgi:hypothetical protein